MPQYTCRQDSVTLKYFRKVIWLRHSPLTPSYRGRITLTSWPAWARALGREPATSARPPVLMKGTASEAANRIFIVRPLSPDKFTDETAGGTGQELHRLPGGNNVGLHHGALGDGQRIGEMAHQHAVL